MRLVLAIFVCASAFWRSVPAQLLNTAPIRFESEPGNLTWRARGLGYAFQFSADASRLRLGDRTVTLTFPSSNRHARVQAAEPFSVPTTYFLGKTQRSVQAYAK